MYDEYEWEGIMKKQMTNFKKRNKKKYARQAHLERGAYTYNLEHTIDYFKQKKYEENNS